MLMLSPDGRLEEKSGRLQAGERARRILRLAPPLMLFARLSLAFVAQGLVAIKNMASGEQRAVERAKVAEVVKEGLLNV